MLKVQVNQLELNKTIGNINRLNGQMRRRAGQIINYHALIIESNAKKAVPVDTGTLRASIMTVKESSFNRTVGTRVEYAPYVEFGTKDKVDTTISGVDYSRVALPFKKSNGGAGGVRPRPYLFPAFEAEKPKVQNALRRLVKYGR